MYPDMHDPLNTKTLQDPTRFSESVLWEYQRDYFHRKGIEAWVRGVPYYVTSNMTIADGYATIALRFIQDGIKNGTIDPKEPIYMFELGTGSGKFSYMYIKLFMEYIDRLGMQDLDVCYVMTDFTEHNLDYWAKHPKFQQYIKRGCLDFAIYNIGSNHDMELVNRKVTLSKGSCKNPVVVIGNYIFDTVTHDAFRIENGKLQEGLVRVATNKENIDETDGHIKELEGLMTEFEFKDIELPYYNRPELDKILEQYQQNLKYSNVLIPLGGITCIDDMRAISNDRVLLISGDKSYTTQDSLENLGTPDISFHGSFSMMVNYDAVDKYVRNLGGDTIMGSDERGFKISIFTLGCPLDSFPETKLAFKRHIQLFSTREYLPIKNKFIHTPHELDLVQIMALMKLVQWDTDIFMNISMALAQCLNQADKAYVDTLRDGLQQVNDNYYHIPEYKNVPFELAHIYHVIGDLPQAIKHYNESIELFGSDSAAFYNRGLCHYYMNDYHAAVDSFKTALQIDAKNKQAKEWLDYIQNQGLLEQSKPVESE